MLKTIKRWLNHHKNHQIGTYMDRWYLIPPQWGLPISVRLQHLRRSDAERLPHNHPYAFKSIVLKGWYDEEQTKGWTRLTPQSDEVVFQRDVVRHSRFKLFRIAQAQYHRIINMPADGVWTIIWHPRKPVESAWGYLNVDGTHIPHDDYVRPPGYDLPYKASAYRRDGPTGAQGPGGPSLGDTGVDGPGGPASHVIDTTDTLDLLSKIEDAAKTQRDGVDLQLHGKTVHVPGPIPPKEWTLTETVLPVQCSPKAEARIKEFLAKGGKIKGERIE